MPNAASNYRKKYGLDVKFVLLEDPAAKLAAFRKGDIDIMWNTVDNWAREASILEENGAKAKSILMQDWSRGGDGIVSLSSIKTIEDLKGRKIACTQFTPSHFLLLYLLAQSGLSPEDRAALEKNIILTQDAPAAAAMFKARQVDAAVTWEPDLSASVDRAGRRGAHPGVDDGRDQHHRRHAGGAPAADRRGARDRARLRAGLVRGDRDDQARPGLVVRAGGPRAQAGRRHGVGHAVGPEADALRRQRPVLRADRAARRTSRRCSTRRS